MKFALAQMEVIPGCPDRNIQSMFEMIKSARNAEADLIIFPELCLSGYILADMWVNESFCENLMQYNNLLIDASKGIAIAYGNIFVDKEINSRWNDNGFHPNKDGRMRKYNAVYVIQDGQYAKRSIQNNWIPEGIQPKTLLPDYRIFDDERYFFSFENVAKDAGVPIEELAQPFLIQTKSGIKKIGFEICEDLWCQEYRSKGSPINLTNMLIRNGASAIVNISASPWNAGKNAARDKRILFLKEDAGENFVPFIYVNQTGTQNNGKNIITFDGGSTVYNSKGKPVLFADKAYQPQLILCDDSQIETPSKERGVRSVVREKMEAIQEGIRHLRLLLPERKSLQFVVGVSGGIDSALVASQLTLACGKKNVLAVNMPFEHNTERTKNAAQQVALNLGLDYLILPITKLYNTNEKIFNSLDGRFQPETKSINLSNENIQAKIRGTSILSNIAGRYGMFMANTSNKLEIALGYTTLYGDLNGAIAPIGDLTKREVIAMARFLNDEIFKREVIPSELFPDDLFRFDKNKISPGPELSKDQVNPLRFGYHCALLENLTDYIRKTPEDLLQWYLLGTFHINLGISINLMQRWNIDDPETFVKDLEWFVSTIQRNIFKRVQAPPIIITSRSAYGYDIRESMLPFEPTFTFRELKEKVLLLKQYKAIE